MFANPRDRLGRHGMPTPAPKHQSLSGLLYLAGAGIAGYYLVIRGAILLLVVMAGQALSNLSQPDLVQADGMGPPIVTGAAIVAVGACLTIGLLWLALRRLAGKPYPRRHAVTLFLVLSAGLIGGSVLIAQRATAPAPLPASHVGLEGVWYPASSGKLAYRFNPDGTLDSWWSGLGGGNPFGTWTRTGQTVTIRTVRDWNFVGTLAGGTITGTVFESSTGKPVAPETWSRPVKP